MLEKFPSESMSDVLSDVNDDNKSVLQLIKNHLNLVCFNNYLQSDEAKVQMIIDNVEFQFKDYSVNSSIFNYM